jgi:hypothetical protein
LTARIFGAQLTILPEVPVRGGKLGVEFLHFRAGEARLGRPGDDLLEERYRLGVAAKRPQRTRNAEARELSEERGPRLLFTSLERLWGALIRFCG